MDLFALTVSPWELVLRGTAIYLGLVLVLRFILRRDVGSLGAPDLLFLILVADAAQNAMAGEYKTISEGAILVGTLVFWNVALDWLAFRYGWARRLIESPALPLVVNGRLQRKNLQRQWITVEELHAKLREHGIEDYAQVRRATLEPDGELSVLKEDGTQADDGERKKLRA